MPTKYEKSSKQLHKSRYLYTTMDFFLSENMNITCMLPLYIVIPRKKNFLDYH